MSEDLFGGQEDFLAREQALLGQDAALFANEPLFVPPVPLVEPVVSSAPKEPLVEKPTESPAVLSVVSKTHSQRLERRLQIPRHRKGRGLKGAPCPNVEICSRVSTEILR